MTKLVALAGLALVLAGCAFPVQGKWVREPGPGIDPQRTIVILFNHGFSRQSAGTYEAKLPPLLERAAKADDVLVFSQVRNSANLQSVDHSSYIETAIGWLTREQKFPVENIIVTGQSCGGWGSLQAVAFSYPTVGGVLVFAPTCHGQLPHSSETEGRRRSEIAQLAARAKFRGVLFLYEGDSYYDLRDWTVFEARVAATPQLKVVKLSRIEVLKLCPKRCVRDSHGAVWDDGFSNANFDTYLQPLLQQVRGDINARNGTPRATR